MLAYRTNHVTANAGGGGRPAGWMPRTTRKAWADDESAFAVALRRKGVSFAEIGRRVGRSGQTVRSHLKALGIV